MRVAPLLLGARAIMTILRSRNLAAIALLLATRSANAQEARDPLPPLRDDTTRDAPLTNAAAVPAAGTVRFTAAGGADVTRGGEAPAGVVGGGFSWSVVERVAVTATTWHQAGVTQPSMGVRWQWLSQDWAPLNATAAVHYSALGMELAGSEIDGRLALSRELGRVLVGAHGIIGRGIGIRNDVDFESAALSTVRLLSTWRVGIEGRARTELEDEYKTPEDEGRPFQLTGGALTSYRYEWLYVQAFGGWNSPRGTARPGPAALASASFEF
jgi:hypothetical protein